MSRDQPGCGEKCPGHGANNESASQPAHAIPDQSNNDEQWCESDALDLCPQRQRVDQPGEGNSTLRQGDNRSHEEQGVDRIGLASVSRDVPDRRIERVEAAGENVTN